MLLIIAAWNIASSRVRPIDFGEHQQVLKWVTLSFYEAWTHDCHFASEDTVTLSISKYHTPGLSSPYPLTDI